MLEQDHVDGKRRAELFVDHRVTAVLDHDRGPYEALHVGKRLDEHRCLVDEILHIVPRRARTGSANGHRTQDGGNTPKIATRDSEDVVREVGIFGEASEAILHHRRVDPDLGRTEIGCLEN